jgi:hypothetical protein
VPETELSSYDTVFPAGHEKVETTVEELGVTGLSPKSVLTPPTEQYVDWLVAMVSSCLKSTTQLPEKENDEVSSWDCSGKRKMREQVPMKDCGMSKLKLHASKQLGG